MDTIGKHYKKCSTIQSLPTRKGEDSFQYMFVDEENYAKFSRTLRLDNQHLQLNFARRFPVGMIVEAGSALNEAAVEPNTSITDLRQPVLVLTDCLVDRRTPSPPAPQGGNDCFNPTGAESPTSPIGDVGGCSSTPPSGDVDGCTGGMSPPIHTSPSPDTTHPTPSNCGAGEVVPDLLAVAAESAGLGLSCPADSARVSPPSPPSQCEKGGVFDGERISLLPFTSEEIFSPAFSSCMDRGMSVCGVSHVTPHTSSHDSIRGEEECNWERGYLLSLREETPFPVTPHLPSRIERMFMEEGCRGEEGSRLPDNNFPDVSGSATPLIPSHVEGGNEDACWPLS